MLPFPVEGEKEGGLEGVSTEEVLLNRRGIAEGSNDSGVDKKTARFYRRQLGGAWVPSRVQVNDLRQGLPEKVQRSDLHETVCLPVCLRVSDESDSNRGNLGGGKRRQVSR